jgi:threonine/homoserine/homoserine lactone efflux protein
MVTPSFVAYLGFAFALVVTPGASTAVVVRNTLLGGRSSGIATAAGAALGNTTYALASRVGTAALFVRWPLAAKVVGIAGALYFVWLGGSSFWRALWPRGRSTFAAGRPESPSGSTAEGVSFREGLSVNLLNPAIASFYFSIVPSFMPPGAAWEYFGALAVSHVSMAFLCHSAWALAFGRLRHLLERGSTWRVLEAVVGLTLLLLAAHVLLRG